MENYNKILVVQTAFIGDVILATSLLESIHFNNPKAEIDILVRKGNESLFKDHPFLNKVWVWDKKTNKTKNLFRLLFDIRKEGFDLTIGVQRFFNAGLLTAFSKSKTTVGFDKNPLAFLFKKSIPHEIGNGKHEVERNYDLIKDWATKFSRNLKLYPAQNDINKVADFKTEEYIVIAPASVWFTKQYPKEKWVEFLNEIKIKTYIIGAPSDIDFAEEIISKTNHQDLHNLCGKLSLLESAALMQDAKMNYVNDSAPQHLASAVNAPTTAIFCSTVPTFGFGPLADNAQIVEVQNKLNCRPCGLHGHKKCPEGHFDCAFKIDTQDLINRAL